MLTSLLFLLFPKLLVSLLFVVGVPSVLEFMLFCCCWDPADVDISSVPSVSNVPAVACLSFVTDIFGVFSIYALVGVSAVTGALLLLT
jgi:hypothetical protein